MKYKSLYHQQKVITTFLIFLNLFTVALFGGAVKSEHQAKKDLKWLEKKELGVERVALDCQKQVSYLIDQKPSFIGKVSYYSEKGCLGCNANQIMANGQKFDEDKFTLAFNRLPLNTVVRVTNLSNGKSELAVVTDRGGFERLGRIADLSKGLMTALGAKTDQSIIKIEVK